MAKRPLTGTHTDGSDHDPENSCSSPPKRPCRARIASPSYPEAGTSSRAAHGETIEVDVQTDDASSAHPSENDVELPTDLDALEEHFRAQIEAERKAKLGKRGRVAQHGIIESVEMHQFMCHKRLSLKLEDQLNFIIGHNGSGKSAILTAITIALGGKAGMTGRGSGLKAFIREGQGVAEVSIVLKNEGDDAYNPDIFGNKITVTRRFTRQGSSSYKICDANGVVVSTKKAELQAICDHMDIQVDNPLIVLTQDAARKFLGATQAKDKYALFLRGTQLQQLSDEYDMVKRNIESIRKVCQYKTADMPSLKEYLDRVKQECADARKAQELRDKERQLLTEQAWAYVADKEKELRQVHEKVAEGLRRCDKTQEKSTDVVNHVAEASGKIRELECQHEKVEEEYISLQKECDDIKQNCKDKTKGLNDLKRVEKEMNEAMEVYKREIADFAEQIAKDSEKLESNSQTRRQYLQARVDDAKVRLSDLEAQLASSNVDRTRLTADLKMNGEKQHDAQQQLDNQRGGIRDLEAQIMMCQAQERDHIAAFGKNIPAVLSVIDGERWFGRKPLGPLGMFVALGDRVKWGDLMRVYIGNQMRSFAISDARDLPKLKNILVKHGNPQNSVIVYKADLFDYTMGEPPSEYATPLRLLQISDEYARRILINSSAIERTYVTPSRREAEMLMNIRKDGVVVTGDCFKVTRWKSDGGRKSEPYPYLHPQDPRNQLFQESDIVKRMNHLHEELKECRAREREFSVEAEKWEKCKADSNEALSQCLVSPLVGRYKDLTRQSKNEKALLNELELEAQEDAPATILAKQDLKRQREGEKEDLLKQFTELQNEKVRKQAEKEALENEHRVKKAAAKGPEARLQELRTEIENVVEDRAKAIHNQQHWNAKLKEEEAKVTGSRVAADVIEEEYKNYVDSAGKIGDQVETQRSPNEIKRQISALREALKKGDQQSALLLLQRKSNAELVIELRKAEAAYQNARADIRSLKLLKSALHSSLVRRQDKWSLWRAYCSMSCKLNFQYNLSNRGYYGQVSMDHGEGLLTLKVQTDDQIESQGHNKDPLSLSGGEKSFSTICLLLALWETIGCPVRCLDEFDVFMDAVNRRISMKMMIETAQTAHGKQYILVTPQDMTNIRPQPGLKVLRMQDPERGQTTLN